MLGKTKIVGTENRSDPEVGGGWRTWWGGGVNVLYLDYGGS